MSVVVVVRKGTHAAIACDTLYSRGSLRVPGNLTRGRSKLVPAADGFLGVVGSSAHPLVLASVMERQTFTLDAPATIFESLRQVQTDLTEHYHLRTDEGHAGQEYHSNQLHFLICNPHGIFEAMSYREVVEFERYWAIGDGAEIALGALWALYDELDDPVEIAIRAATAACTFIDSCALPLHVESIELAVVETLDVG